VSDNAGVVALTALLVAIGCQPDELRAVMDRLGRQDVAGDVEGVYRQARLALEQVREGE